MKKDNTMKTRKKKVWALVACMLGVFATSYASPVADGDEDFKALARAVQKYKKVEDFSEGAAKVALGGTWKDDGYGYAELENAKYGLINARGEEVIPCKYDEVGLFSEGLAPVGLDRKYGYVDKNGNDTFSVK